MDSSLLADPWIAAQVDAAVAPYVGRLSPGDIAWMREQLAEVLSRDPRATRLLRDAHPREPDQSGERLTPGAPGSGATPAGSGGRAKAG